MVDFASLLDPSRGALYAVAGKAVGQDTDNGNDHDESLWQTLLPRDPDMDMGFTTPATGTNWRSLMLWVAVVAVCFIIAVATNPNEGSFRSYLTELSFRRHLVDIRTDDSDSAALVSEEGSTGKSDPTPSSPALPAHAADHPIAPFRFANHVSISLRTPTLCYKTLFVLSIALTSPLGPPAFLSDPITLVRTRGHVQKERLVLHVGYLGHWVQVGIVPRRLEWTCRLWAEGATKEKRKKADRPGVMELKAIQPKEETPAKSSSLAPPAKHLRRSGSNNDLSSLPLGLTTFPDSRRASVVSLLPPSDATDSSPAVVALKTELSKAQDALTDLKSQLLAHEQSVSDAHASLQVSLDDLRTKRKEDDAERAELKSRTKALEEQKRQAEAGRRDAEKKLRAAEGLRDSILGRIEAAKRDVAECGSQIEASERAVRLLTEEGARFVVETQQLVESKQHELETAEGQMKELEDEVNALGDRVREAEERLKETQARGSAPTPPPANAPSAAASAVANAIVGKNLGPEEEMMMMAAAYEAAAQEGYQSLHQPQHHQQTNHGYSGHHAALGHASNSWASQAAAYMAEAGMPSLDQNYTARPTYSARTISGNASDTVHNGNGNGKRIELLAYDDFGPGQLPFSQDPRDKRISGEGFGQVLGLAANRLSQAQQSDEDTVSESELYGLDPSSPNGGISTSFSANLLGQGLFNSLVGGDQTPIDGSTDDGLDEDNGTTLEEALNFAPAAVQAIRDGRDEEGHDSGEESEDEWKSPMAEPRIVSASQADDLAATSARAKRFSFSRTSPLNPARVPSAAPSATSSAAHSAHTPTPPSLPGLPALPALPGSRRWFSGTMSASAENLHAFPYQNQSSDSLSLHPQHQAGGQQTLGQAQQHHPGPASAASLYESPFAPSESERKKLMGLGGMWGMGGLGKRFSTSSTGPANAHSGQSEEASLLRSTSLDHARGQSAPIPLPRSGLSHGQPGGVDGKSTGTSPQQSWMARHLHVPSGLGNGISFNSQSPPDASGMRNFFSTSPNASKSPAAQTSSPGGPSSSPGRSWGWGDQTRERESSPNKDKTDRHLHVDGEADGEEKKGFKLFSSLRKPSKLGSSPGAQSGTSGSSN